MESIWAQCTDDYHMNNIWRHHTVYMWGKYDNSHIDQPCGIHMEIIWEQCTDDYHMGNIWYDYMVYTWGKVAIPILIYHMAYI